MASSTKALPVALIPEQALVTSVRNNVIHNGCRDDLALRLAEGAQRMLLQEESAGLTPAAVVPTGIRSAAQPVTAPFYMILTEHLTLLSEAWTIGIAAGSSWFLGHLAPPSDNQKSTGTREEVSAEETHKLLDHMFRGNASLLVNQLVDSGDLSAEDLQEILKTMCENGK